MAMSERRIGHAAVDTRLPRMAAASAG
jgi:hypothetical protein